MAAETLYAYVYVKAKTKYYTLEESDIVNFSYENLGNQSVEFSSKPFKCYLNDSEKQEVCQILIVAQNAKDLKNYLSKQRVKVPNLNKSDLEKTPNLTPAAEKHKAQKNKKVVAKKRKIASEKTNSEIIRAYSNASVRTTGLPTTSTPKSFLSISPPKSPPNENQSDGTFTDSDIDPLAGDDEQAGNRSDSPPFQNIDDDDGMSDNGEEEETTNRNEENGASGESDNSLLERTKKEFEKKLAEEKKKNTILVRSNRLFQEKLLQLNKKACKTAQTGAKADKESEKQPTKKREGFPTPINTGSGIMARAEAVDNAYSKDEPSKFYINLCYATWGYKDLSERCIKKSKKTLDKKVLTPKKKRTVNQHFTHYLEHYNYSDYLSKVYTSKANIYAHRAIVNAKAHMKLIEQYPELGENNEDANTEMIEL
ncbi:uncharacterized protein LOC116416253 [Nasonia vitripennis]|uniref:Uncharacterized protein n=1 Tax=Nasonia vitripennis TaxID=7425 RepID=A0A7M7Q4R8_NASVI|nr:uncharacterized protein LOC116416253 [Nasonia vitripennis]XP_032457377.1 uncharacterized protein LOC116416253 [Nasonia vitripennis]